MQIERRLVEFLARILNALSYRVKARLMPASGRRRVVKLTFISLVLSKFSLDFTVAASAQGSAPKPKPIPRPDPRRAPPAASGPGTTRLRVNSAVAQTDVAFVDSCGSISTPIACVFAQGEVTGSLLIAGQPRLHVVPLAKWNDGSLKHCAIVGVWSPVAGDNTLTLQTGTPATNPMLAAVVPADSVALGGTTLALAQATLHRTWFATPDMIERHYRAKTGTRYVWWYVRQWSNGAAWIGRKVENNRSQDSGVGGRTGVDPFTRINDAVRVGSFQAVLPHDPNSAYFAENWVSGVDPGTTYLHDPLALSRSMMVPNWIRRSNGQDEDNSKAYVFAQSTYSPLTRGTHAPDWALGGYRQQLGVIPKWDAVMAKYADARGMAWGKTQGFTVSSFTVVIRDPSTHNAPKPSQIPVRDSPTFAMSGNGFQWDSNHGCNSGYVPYLLTGDFRFWETMLQHCAALVYFTGSTDAFKVARAMTNGEPRGVAWTLRTLAQTVSTAPEVMEDADLNAIVAEYRQLLDYNVGIWLDAGTLDVRPPGPYTATHPGNPLGIAFGLVGEMSGGRRYIAPFMYVGYWTHAVAHLLDVQALKDDTRARALMTWIGRSTVGMLGPGGEGNWSWDMVFQDPGHNGGYLLVTSADDGTSSMLHAYKDWGDVYLANFGAWRTPTNTVQPFLGNVPTAEASVFFSDCNWVLHAISDCVNHGVPGAEAAFARLAGADNFKDFGGDGHPISDPTFRENIGYGATPTEGIVPRTWVDGKPPGSSAAPPVAASGAGIRALPRGQWADTGLRLLDPLITAYSGGILNTKGVYKDGTFIAGTFLCMFGGGHADSNNNAMYAIGPFESDFPTCFQLSRNTKPKDVWFDANGYPVSNHTYDAGVYLPDQNMGLWCGFGARYISSWGDPDPDGSRPSTSYMFDFNVPNPMANKPWIKGPQNGFIAGGDAVSGYDNGAAWAMGSDGHVVRFNPVSPSWTDFGIPVSDNPGQTFYGLLGGSTGADVHDGILVAECTGKVYRIDLAARRVRITTPPGDAPQTQTVHRTSTVWVNGRWIVFQDGTRTLYSLDKDCTRWSSETAPGGLLPISQPGSGTYSRFGYIPGLGYYLVEVYGQVLLWRL